MTDPIIRTDKEGYRQQAYARFREKMPAYFEALGAKLAEKELRRARRKLAKRGRT